MSIIVALFMGLTVSAEEIIRDRKILKRESFLNLSRASYLLSKISILFTLSAIQTLTFVIIGNSILGIHDMFFTHWLILFSTSCMANILGLNISSSFNSAVTIYILIPILLIPQLILSGVVVKFDKLNPSLSEIGKVPVVGEMMASRWAFEAAMVSQFKDNQYENRFYAFDQVMAACDYKRIYYIPELESRLEYCLNNLRDEREAIKQVIEKNLLLLRNELPKELAIVGQDKFTRVNDLTLSTFNGELYNETMTFLETLSKFYSHRHQRATEEKDKLLVGINNTEEERKAFQQIKNDNYNESIADVVKNQAEPQRIIERDSRLYQKIYPIYMTPQPGHLLDFRTEFYVPVKHFLGQYIDTFYFNILVIWSMSIFLIVTLYFDALGN